MSAPTRLSSATAALPALTGGLGLYDVPRLPEKESSVARDAEEDSRAREDRAVRAVLAGDVNAFSDLVRLHVDSVRCLIASRIPSVHQVNELAQETFLFAYRNLQKFEPGTSFGKWVRAIAWNYSRRELQRCARESQNLQRYGKFCEEQASEASGNASPMEAYRLLESCLDMLPPKQREVIGLKYEHKLSSRAIGERIGSEEAGVRVLLFRIRKALRRCIETRGSQAQHSV